MSATAPVIAELEAAGLEVDASSRRLAEYSYDASNYRVPPVALVFPRTPGDVQRAVLVCRRHATPVVPRGGGTSMAGNAVGRGVVLDFSRHMTAIGELDTVSGTVGVQPGVVLGSLSAHVEEASGGTLTFAPDPSSKSRATVGGAIGNDACGNHSVRHGRTSDHLVEVDLVTSDGALLTAFKGGLRPVDPADAHSARRAREIEDELRRLAGAAMAPLRTRLGQIPRQVSGYHLHHLLPEHGFDLARALAGSEGTCAVVVGARMRVVRRPAATLLVCLGYPDVVEAARDVPLLLEYRPAAVEAIDEAIVATVRWRRGAHSVSRLPRGRAWLYVELDGDDAPQVEARARELLGRLRAAGRLTDGRPVPDPAERAALWKVREDGAGLSARPAAGAASDAGESWPGWEDSAVGPARLADYLADLRRLLESFGLDAVMYGHFGAGCVHARITYDLRRPEGVAVFERFNTAAAKLVVAHGGSLSGEHGDGRARSQLLRLMYGAEIMGVFAAFKRAWDPERILNPGSIVDAAEMAADLALTDVPARPWDTAFHLPARDGLDGFVHAVQGCIGVARCRSDSGGVMCPSYRATHDEKDSTRGRARVLQEMVRGARTPKEGWRSREVREALDLCLSCKACATDCPTGVDMATYKAEFFHHHYGGRLRPASHYSLGWLPRWTRLASRAPGPVNALLATPLSGLAMRLGGLTTRRRLPRFAGHGAWLQAVRRAGAHRAGSGEGDVILFVDTFTRAFRPEVAGAASAVIGGAGERVECAADACCGLTWISTGQLGTAARRLARAADALDDGTERPIVVVEPSCAATLSKDLPELVVTTKARRVAARVRSFTQHVGALGADGRLAPPASGVPDRVVVQTHCHEYAVFGAATQRRALAAVGATDVREATGCCGVAGNFGFEAAHYETSMQVASQALGPALDGTGESVPVLTDGFSCHMQVNHLAPARTGRHLAEILDPRPSSPLKGQAPWSPSR